MKGMAAKMSASVCYINAVSSVASCLLLAGSQFATTSPTCLNHVPSHTRPKPSLHSQSISSSAPILLVPHLLAPTVCAPVSYKPHSSAICTRAPQVSA